MCIRDRTTTIGKLAYQFKKAGKSVYLGAADTFRAAAVEQLMIWGERVGAVSYTHLPSWLHGRINKISYR